MGLHDDAHNARDYASSTDPGTTESDHQRIVVPGREVYAYGEGNILGVYFNEHNKNYPTSPGNDDGITIEVLYFDGYRVKYTHVVPSERLLEISGVNKSDVRFYHPEVNPTLKGDTSIHEGDLIGSYNQIGFSPDIPHLHIDTWDKQGHPIDPKDTGIPERTLR